LDRLLFKMKRIEKGRMCHLGPRSAPVLLS
jgi:hypothetical protein